MGQKKDTSKYTLYVNADGSLTFHSDGYPDMTLKKQGFLVHADPAGKFEGSVPNIIDITVDITSSTAADVDVNVKIAKQEIKCSNEAIAITGNKITFPNIGKSGDCLGDALRTQKKDTSKYTLDVNADGSLTFHSDGYPDMKLKKQSLLVRADPTGKYEGSVPFIIDITVDITSSTTADVDVNVKIAKQEIKCSNEAIAITGNKITFP